MDAFGNVTIYKNGVAVGSGPTAVPNPVTRTGNYAGRSNWPGDGYYQGKMDDLRIYTRVLDPAQSQLWLPVEALTIPTHKRSSLSSPRSPQLQKRILRRVFSPFLARAAPLALSRSNAHSPELPSTVLIIRTFPAR